MPTLMMIMKMMMMAMIGDDDLDDGDDDDIGTLHPEGGQKEMAPWCANSARSGRW